MKKASEIFMFLGIGLLIIFLIAVFSFSYNNIDVKEVDLLKEIYKNISFLRGVCVVCFSFFIAGVFRYFYVTDLQIKNMEKHEEKNNN